MTFDRNILWLVHFFSEQKIYKTSFSKVSALHCRITDKRAFSLFLIYAQKPLHEKFCCNACAAPGCRMCCHHDGSRKCRRRRCSGRCFLSCTFPIRTGKRKRNRNHFSCDGSRTDQWHGLPRLCGAFFPCGRSRNVPFKYQPLWRRVLMSYNNTKLVAGLLGYALLACSISGCSFDVSDE